MVWTVGTDNKARLYVNGVLTYTDTDPQAIISQTHGGSIGSRLDIAGNPFKYFPGSLDEVRISNVARSADWIATEYNNQGSPATFYTVSAANVPVATAPIHWLVTDHLGTPRMIFDQSGSLTFTENGNYVSGMTRHDYLPFGEDLAGVAGRTIGRGYVNADGARQKFTLKERDSETHLDYFLARYYSSEQLRFTSPDELTGGPDELYDFADDASDNPTFYAELDNPQSLNKYQYTYNNPVNMTDDDGHCPLCAAIEIGLTVVDVITTVQTLRDPNASRTEKVIVTAGTVAGLLLPGGGYGASGKLGVKLLAKQEARVAARTAGEVVEAGSAARTIIKANAAKGAAFEEKVLQRAAKTQTGVVSQLTVKTKNNVKTRIDCVGCDAKTGAVRLTEAKSSATAPLTKNQRKAFPEIERSGARVVGRGKPGFPGGAKIKATKVDVVRPE